MSNFVNALNEPQSEEGNETSMVEENADELQTSPSNAAQALESSQYNIENTSKVNEIFEWIETKIELLKILQGNDESEINATEDNDQEPSNEDRTQTLEEMLEEIHKITSKENTLPKSCLSEEVIKMLDMLEETTMGLLDNLNISEKRCRSIKVLATLIQHLSASVGTKVTLEDIQKHIDGKRVLELYREVQDSREPVLLKLEALQNHIEHGIKRSQYIANKCERYKSEVDGLYSENNAPADRQIVNENLKKVTKESIHLLVQYSDSIGHLVSKTKTFFSLKQDSEKLLNTLMTKEIPDLYKT